MGVGVSSFSYNCTSDTPVVVLQEDYGESEIHRFRRGTPASGGYVPVTYHGRLCRFLQLRLYSRYSRLVLGGGNRPLRYDTVHIGHT